MAASAVAVEALPVREPTNEPAVILPSVVIFVLKEPFVLPRFMVTSAAPKSAAALCKLEAFSWPATSAVAKSTALVVLPEPTRLVALVELVTVILSGMSASVKDAQVKFPLAAMVVANWLALQSDGLAANAVAAVARSIVMPFGMSLSVSEAQVRLPLAAMVVAN